LIYEYKCKCGHEFEVSKKVANRGDCETCVVCHNNEVLKREIPSRISGFIGANDWDTAHHSPTLGIDVRNHTHAKKEAKARGMTEMGDEPIEYVHKKYDNQRKQKSQESWDKVNMDHGNIRSK
jgi:hypothetical protein